MPQRRSAARAAAHLAATQTRWCFLRRLQRAMRLLTCGTKIRAASCAPLAAPPPPHPHAVDLHVLASTSSGCCPASRRYARPPRDALASGARPRCPHRVRALTIRAAHGGQRQPAHRCQHAAVRDGEAARHDARNSAPLQAAAAFAVNLTRQANDKGGKRAAAAQQPQPLLAAVAPRLQRRQFKQTRRQLECQLRRRLQVMRARGSASEDGASGCSVQHKTHDVTALQNG
jgi:hypothetical protein